MRLVSVIIPILLAMGAYGWAEDQLVVGGDSPDGKFEVRIYKTNQTGPSNYYYAMVDTKSKKLIKHLIEGGGFASYEGAGETAQVLWHPSSHLFALTDHGTRHSMELYVYRISPPNVELLRTPDYFQKALGRIGATEGYLTSVVKPLRWQGDTLISQLIFDAYETRDGGVRGRSPFYKTTFSVQATKGSDFLQFTGMEKPQVDDQ